MYLTERLIGVTIHAVILLYMCFLLSRSGKNLTSIVLWFYIALLTVMGYFFVPHTGADLSRLLIAMRSYASMSINGIWGEIKSTGTPGVPLYYYIIGQFDSDKLLPAISAFITYTFVFSIFRKTRKIDGCAAKDAAIIMFLFMSRGLFMQIISNIRTIMVLAICAWCIYQEMFSGKKIYQLIIPYLLAASLHVMGQLILLYRVAYLFVESGKSVNKRIARGLLAGVAVAAILVFARSYIDRLFEKGTNYLSYSQAGTGYYYFWEAVLSVAAIGFTVYFLLKFKRICSKSVDKRDDSTKATVALAKYVTPLVILDVLLFFVEFNVFQRLSWYLTILCIPLGMMTLREARKNGLHSLHMTMSRTIVVASSAMLLLASIRGDLCSLKFFQL